MAIQKQSVILRFPPYLFLSLFIQATVIYPALSCFMFSQNERLLIIAISGSVFSVFILFLFYLILNRFFKKYYPFHFTENDFFLMCFCGLISTFSPYIIIRHLLGYTIIYLTVLQLQRFIRQMSVFLGPNRYVTKRELSVFILFFAELIILFTLINLLFNIPQNPVIRASETIITGDIKFIQINNIINALYFTVITMTTVGFGDFIPLTYYGKILVISECLTSYIIFGLMIGLIVRGIRYSQTKKRLLNKRNHKKNLNCKNNNLKLLVI